MKQFQKLLKAPQFGWLAKLQKKFPRAEVFLVGGIIRDTLLNRASKDFDFVVRNISAASLQKFLKPLGWVDFVGKSFGVFKFIPQQFKHLKQLQQFEPTRSELVEPIDIALPRTEHSLLTGGYRDFKIQSDPKLPIAQDLGRRDFTINALAYDIKNGKLIDLFDGLKDLNKKIIRTVGQPKQRFQEDNSRLLRALRFACQLNFKIEPKTNTALKRLIPSINKKNNGLFIVPRETVAKELAKSFLAAPDRALVLFEKTGIIKNLMPELLTMKTCPQPRNFHSEGNVWKHTLLCLKNLHSIKFVKEFGSEKLSPELVFGLLFHDLGKPYTLERMDRLRFNNHDSVGATKARAIMERLKLSNAGLDVEKAFWLIKHHMLVTHAKGSGMRKTTLEKYFYNDLLPGRDLLKLTFADIMATVPPSGQPNFADYRRLERQILALKKIARQRVSLPPEILDGHAIMKKFNLKPGQEIGRLKEKLREEQLKGKIINKKEAFALLKKYVRIPN